MNTEVNYISTQSAISWDEYFMLQAMIAAFKSKDPATKVGCVFVDDNNHQITFGYNGFIAGIDETKLPWGKDRSVPLEFQKHGYVVHAEANAILHSARLLSDSRCYVTLFPCHECAKLLASCKVKEIVYLQSKGQDRESYRIAQKIFDLTNISYRQLSIDPQVLEKLNLHISEQVSQVCPSGR